MAKEKKEKNKCRNTNSGCGGVYGLGLIGALFYFLQQSTTFWDGVMAILKAFIWPILLIYKLLGFLGI